MHRRGLLAVARLLFCTGAVAQQVVREQPITLQLDVDALGQVTAAKPMGPLPILIPNRGRLVAERPMYAPLSPLLAQAAVQVASQWRFKPIVVAGQPATGRTWANATLQIVKRDDGNFAVALRYVRNGPCMTTVVDPSYPEHMRQPGKSGAIVMEYTVEADGTIDKAHVVRVFGDAVDHQQEFEDAVRPALAKSRSMPLMINGIAIATRVRRSFIFVVDLHMKDKIEELKRQVHETVDPRSTGAPDTPPTSGETVAVDSPFAMQSSG